MQTNFGPKPCSSYEGIGINKKTYSSSEDKSLVDTSDWWHGGSWIIYGAVGIIGVIGLFKSCG